MVETKPDIAFSTAVSSRFLKNPSHQHMEAAKTILNYLKGSKLRGMTYGGGEELMIQSYSDSDWAGDKESRKSTFGYIFMLNGGPVSWCSKSCIIVDRGRMHCPDIGSQLRLLLTELGLLDPNDQHAQIKIN